MRADIHRTVDAVYRMEATRLIACAARIVRDLSVAEEIAHDALVAALERWPGDGVPDNPAAWLMTAARRKAIDRFRRQKSLDRKRRELAREAIDAVDGQSVEDFISETEIQDNVLRLIFMTCHPALSPDARVALTLRLVCSISTTEIARAFLVGEPAIAQRIVRAKRFLVKGNVRFDVPVGDELENRMTSVLEVIYLIYNAGYTAHDGSSWMRTELCEDALRLGRMLAELTPFEPEVHGLVALMEIQSSRMSARVDEDGEPILLLDQNRSLWDQLLIHRGIAAIERAMKLHRPLGQYVLQASIASCHATAKTAEQTDWHRIAELYNALMQIAPSPVVELNRGVAVAMATGPAEGLAIVDRLTGERALKDYHLLPSVRGDLLFRLDRFPEALTEYERAVSLAQNDRERELLARRADECRSRLA